MTAPCSFRSLVERHFAHGLASAIAPRDEHALRGHLGACASCRALYQRYLLLARFDRRIPSAEDRLARGLGLARRRPWARPMAIALSLAAVLVALHLGRELRPEHARAGDADYTARGGAPADDDPALYVYRVAGGGPPLPVLDGAIRRSDELAFAYRNRAGWQRLLVYAVDEAGRVYWYHPGWTDAATAPAAVAIDGGPERHELAEAVAQPLPAGRIQIHAIFTDEAIDVQAIERGVRPARRAELVIALDVAGEDGR